MTGAAPHGPDLPSCHPQVSCITLPPPCFLDLRPHSPRCLDPLSCLQSHAPLRLVSPPPCALTSRLRCKSGRTLRDFLSLSGICVHTLCYSTQEITAPFLLPEMVDRLAAMLNYFLLYLTGPPLLPKPPVARPSLPLLPNLPRAFLPPPSSHFPPFLHVSDSPSLLSPNEGSPQRRRLHLYPLCDSCTILPLPLWLDPGAPVL